MLPKEETLGKKNNWTQKQIIVENVFDYFNTDTKVIWRYNK